MLGYLIHASVSNDSKNKSYLIIYSPVWLSSVDHKEKKKNISTTFEIQIKDWTTLIALYGQKYIFDAFYIKNIFFCDPQKKVSKDLEQLFFFFIFGSLRLAFTQ